MSISYSLLQTLWSFESTEILKWSWFFLNFCLLEFSPSLLTCQACMEESSHLGEGAWPSQPLPHELSFHPGAVIAGNKINRKVKQICVNTSPPSDLFIAWALKSVDYNSQKSLSPHLSCYKSLFNALLLRNQPVKREEQKDFKMYTWFLVALV